MDVAGSRNRIVSKVASTTAIVLAMGALVGVSSSANAASLEMSFDWSKLKLEVQQGTASVSSNPWGYATIADDSWGYWTGINEDSSFSGAFVEAFAGQYSNSLIVTDGEGYTHSWTWYINHLVLGAESSVTVTVPYTYSYDFTAEYDLWGQANFRISSYAAGTQANAIFNLWQGDIGSGSDLLQFTIHNASAEDATFDLSPGLWLRAEASGGPQINEVPIPGTLGLLGIGLAGLSFVRRKADIKDR